MLKKLWKPLLIVGAVLVVMTAGAAVFVPRMADAAGVNLGWRGWLGGPTIDREALLADALGISVEELQTARENARAAAIQKAADDGLITQEQADEMILWGGGRRGPGRDAGFAGKDAEDALLAAELGISIDDLQAAKEQAEVAAIEQALAEEMITQEQADQMLAANALRSYLDKDALLAEALGISVEDLRSGQSEGKSLTDFLAEQNLDAVTVRQNMLAARENAVQQAVTDGVITQEQADQIGERGFRFFEGGKPGRPGPRDGGDFGPRGHHGDGGSGPRGGGDFGRPQAPPPAGSDSQTF
jgi:lambda repressor-like predicted transcriptional regulator